MMRIIAITFNEIEELLYEAKEYITIAFEIKKNHSELAEDYIELSNHAISHAEKLYKTITKCIDNSELNKETEEYVCYENKLYIKKLEKVKLYLSIYNKML